MSYYPYFLASQISTNARKEHTNVSLVGNAKILSVLTDAFAILLAVENVDEDIELKTVSVEV